MRLLNLALLALLFLLLRKLLLQHTALCGQRICCIGLPLEFCVDKRHFAFQRLQLTVDRTHLLLERLLAIQRDTGGDHANSH